MRTTMFEKNEEVVSDFSPTFEISIFVPNADGSPSKKRKTFSSDHALDIYNFWMRNKAMKKKAKKRSPNQTKKINKQTKIIQMDLETTNNES